MTTTSWTGGSGNWTDPTWTDGVPNAALDAIVNGPGTAPITLTFDAPDGAAHLLTMTNATLAVVRGTLDLGAASSLDALSQAGGLLDLAAGGALGGSVEQGAGTLAVDSGALLVNDGGSFAGTLTGAGEIAFAAGNVTLQSGLGLSVAALLVEDSATLAGNITDTGAFTLAADGTLALGGHSFAAEQVAVLAGLLAGPGGLLIAGEGTGGNLAATGGATIEDDGTLTAHGLFTLGTNVADQATLAIGSGTFGTFDLEAGSGIAGNGSILIGCNGTLNDTAPGTISVAGTVINEGIIASYSTTFQTVTTNTLLFSAGTFTSTERSVVSAERGNIVFGPDATLTNLANGTLTAGLWSAYDGTLALIGGPITTIDADVVLSGEGAGAGPGPGVIAAGNGKTFTPLQKSLSTIADGGALTVGGGSYVTRKNVLVNGLLALSGGDQFGTLRIGATGGLEENGTLKAASIRSAGQVFQDYGAHTILKAPFASTGTMFVNGELELQGPSGSANFLGGMIGGNGTLVFWSGTSTTIGRGIRSPPPCDGGTVRDVADNGGAITFDTNLAYHGNFGAGAGSELHLNGHTVKLAQGNLIGDPIAGARVDGGGTLVELGNRAIGYLTFSGGTELANNGVIRESGPVTLGDASGGTASIVNGAGATYTMAGSVSLSAADPTDDTVTNEGLFAKTGNGTATIGAAFTNTGTIAVVSGTLEITAPFTNTGTISGTEIQSNGTTFITAPSPALFNQYVSAMDAPGASPLAVPPPAQPATPTLALQHAA